MINHKGASGGFEARRGKSLLDSTNCNNGLTVLLSLSSDDTQVLRGAELPPFQSIDVEVHVPVAAHLRERMLFDHLSQR